MLESNPERERPEVEFSVGVVTGRASFEECAILADFFANLGDDLALEQAPLSDSAPDDSGPQVSKVELLPGLDNGTHPFYNLKVFSDGAEGKPVLVAQKTFKLWGFKQNEVIRLVDAEDSRVVYCDDITPIAVMLFSLVTARLRDAEYHSLN